MSMNRSQIFGAPMDIGVLDDVDFTPSTFDVSGEPSCLEYMEARGIDPRAATVPQICDALNASGAVSDRPLTVSADGQRLEVDMSFRPATPVRIEIVGGDAVDVLGLGKRRFARPEDFGMTAWPRIYEVKYAEPRIDMLREGLRRHDMMVLDNEFTRHTASPAPVLSMSGLSLDVLSLFTYGAALAWRRSGTVPHD